MQNGALFSKVTRKAIKLKYNSKEMKKLIMMHNFMVIKIGLQESLIMTQLGTGNMKQMLDGCSTHLQKVFSIYTMTSELCIGTLNKKTS